MGVDAVPNVLPESWEPVPHTKLLAQPEYKGNYLVLTQLDIPYVVDSYGKTAPF